MNNYLIYQGTEWPGQADFMSGLLVFLFYKQIKQPEMQESGNIDETKNRTGWEGKDRNGQDGKDRTESSTG